MMHLKITDEIRERCLREAAHDAHINDRIVTSTVTLWMPVSTTPGRCPASS